MRTEGRRRDGDNEYSELKERSGQGRNGIQFPGVPGCEQRPGSFFALFFIFCKTVALLRTKKRPVEGISRETFTAKEALGDAIAYDQRGRRQRGDAGM